MALILGVDMGNIFLNSPPRERDHVTLGLELFGKENEGKMALVVRALYGQVSKYSLEASFFYLHKE